MTEELQISERERDILRLLATGATNQQIASQLNISINTVKVHVRDIYEKIGVVSRPEATLYAVRTGLVSVDKVATVAEQPAILVEDDPLEAPPTLSEPQHSAVPAPVAEAVPEPQPLLPQAPAPAPLAANGTEPSLAPGNTGRTLPRADERSSSRRGLLVGGVGIAVAIIALALAFLQPWRTDPSVPSTPFPSDPSVASSVPSVVPAPSAAASQNSPVAERWRELAPLPEPRQGFALAAFRFDGRSYFYLIGGLVDGKIDGGVLRYDLDADTWVKFSPKPLPVSGVQAAVVGNRIFVAGGRDGAGKTTSVFEAYDPQRDRWEQLAPLPEPRTDYALAAVEGKIYLFGGSDDNGPRAEVWQYSPDRDEWQPQTALPTTQTALSAAVIDGQVFLVGGANEQGELTTHQRYNPAEEGNGNPYTIRAPLPEARSYMSTTRVGSYIFLFGGAEGAEALIYDSNVDTWRTDATPLAPALRELRAEANGNRIYLFGGQAGNAASDRSYSYQALYELLVIPN